LRASDLTKGDGRQALNAAKANGAGTGLLKNIKSSVNVVFNWALEEKYILGVSSSPVEGLLVAKKEEKIPKILTKEELRTLLRSAKLDNNIWYPIWSFAVLTGMRSGELMALQWKDIDLEKRIISVSKSYNNARRKIKCTKSGYWRSVPISNDLRGVINELRDEDTKPEDFVLDRHYAWKNGQAGRILRQYLKDIGIISNVVFHTLRACFATHMLASGADQATVMKIGGWRDIKTFQIYVRLAGIEVTGATDVLDVMPNLDTLTGGKVVKMSEFVGRA
jgi:integrase